MAIQHWVGLNQSEKSKTKDRDFLENATGMQVNAIDYNHILKYKPSMLKDYCEEIYLELLEEGNSIVSGFSTGGSIAIALSGISVPKHILEPEMYILKAPTIWPRPISKKGGSAIYIRTPGSKVTINEKLVALYYAGAAMANARNVKAPALVLQGTNDGKIFPSGAEWLCNHMPKDSVNMLIELNGGHNLYDNSETEKCASEHIRVFIKTYK